MVSSNSSTTLNLLSVQYSKLTRRKDNDLIKVVDNVGFIECPMFKRDKSQDKKTNDLIKATTLDLLSVH